MGAWAWSEVADRLRALGHRPHPLTLSGLEHDGLWPPPDAEGLSYEKDLTEPQRRRLLDRFVKHPGRTVTEPVGFEGSLAEQRATYIVCATGQGETPAVIVDLKNEPTWTIRRIAAGHFPMLSVPTELADIIALAAADVEGRNPSAHRAV